MRETDRGMTGRLLPALFACGLGFGSAGGIGGCAALEEWANESASEEGGIEEGRETSGDEAGSGGEAGGDRSGRQPEFREAERQSQTPDHQRQSRMMMSPDGELATLFETTRRPIETATEDPEGPALKRMSRRNVVLWPLVEAGRIGHDTKGYLVARDPKVLAETVSFDGRSATVEQVLATENADRKAVVKIVAERRDGPGTALEGYEQAAFQAWFGWIEPGQWLFTNEGAWVQVD